MSQVLSENSGTIRVMNKTKSVQRFYEAQQCCQLNMLQINDLFIKSCLKLTGPRGRLVGVTGLKVPTIKQQSNVDELTDEPTKYSWWMERNWQ